MNLAVALDGILRAPTGAVIPEGRYLIEALRPMGRIVFMCDTTEDDARRWLQQNRVPSEEILGTAVDLGRGEPLRHRQINVLRALGPMRFVVDPDPSVVAWALSEGITSLLFAHPVFALPKNRPDIETPKRKWADIEEEYVRQLTPLPKESEDAGF